MKRILIISLSLFAILSFVLCFCSYSFFSVIPGWKTTIIPEFIKYAVIIFINILLPIFLYSRFKNLVKQTVFVIYFLAINLLWICSNLLPQNFCVDEEFDFNAYENYLKIISYLYLTAIIIHITFYIFLLTIKIREIKK